MNLRSGALIFVTAVAAVSCSEKAHTPPRQAQSQVEAGEREGERQPPEDKIAEDCAAFVRSTKVVPAGTRSSECPGCPAEGTDLLSFRRMTIDAVSCSTDSCNVVVTIIAAFNRGSGERIAGGLTGWITAEERSAYLSGDVPSEEQTYRVQITYKRRGEQWRAVEYARAK